MRLITPNKYLEQKTLWPDEGKHILATYDEHTIIVYQAYHEQIANYAVKHQRFGGAFSMNRMSWIKPNFLWMMFRSGWATKLNQERILAIQISRSGFEQLLQSAVHSSYQSLYQTKELWKKALKSSSVRLQWDPDHDPYGNKLKRKAIQLGLKDDSLRKYVDDWIVQIEDITSFVAEQRALVYEQNLQQLFVPSESIYPLPQGIETQL